MFPDGVERKIVGRKTHYTWQSHSPWLAPLRRIAFRMRVRRRPPFQNPHVVIAWEPAAMALLSSLAMGAGGRRRLVWHFHEYPDLNPSLGRARAATSTLPAVMPIDPISWFFRTNTEENAFWRKWD